MAIAETESKKSDADDTSTGGSKDDFAESKSPTGDEVYPGNSSSKMYTLYSNLKDFAFSMPDGWDDKNISIFLGCCRESIDDFRDQSGNDDNHIWHKIAKAGADKSGSTTCFTVNSCIELAQCLKGYVIKNEKRIVNEAFKILYDDIIDLLPYFPGSTENTNKNVRHRSRSKSTEKKDVYSKNIPSVDSEASVVSQKDSRPQSLSTHQIENLIISHCHQNLPLFGKPKTPVTYIWNSVSQKIFEKTGVKIDVKKKLEWIKRKIVKEANKETDKKMRAKKFLILSHEYIKFFDYMPPRTIKKKTFLGVDDIHVKDDPPSINVPLDNESIAPNVDIVTDIEYVHKKRRFSKTNTSDTNGITPSDTTSKSSEHPPNLIKEDDHLKTDSGISSEETNSVEVIKSCSDNSGGTVHVGRVQDSEKQDTNTSTERPVSPTSNKVQVSSGFSNQETSVGESGQTTQPSESKSISSSVLSDPNVTTTTWVKETSPDTSESDVLSKSSQPSRTNYSNLNEHLRLEEDPDVVFFETNYTLRGVTDNIKCYKPRPRKTRKPRGKAAHNVQNFEKRVLPQRSARRKTTSYKVSEEETSQSPVASNQQNSNLSPKRSCSPELRGFPVESSPSSMPPLSPFSKIKRDYTRKPKTLDNNEETFNKRKIPRKESVPPSSKKRIYQPSNKNPVSKTRDVDCGKSRNMSPYSKSQNKTSAERDPQYLEKVYGLRRKQNNDSGEESGSSKRSPVMMEQVDKSSSRTQIETYRGRGQVDSPKFVSGIHSMESHKKMGLGHSAGSKGNSNFSPANAYCPDSDSGSAEPCRPSSSSSGQLPQNSMAKPTALKSMREKVDMLEDMDASTLAIIEKYKTRVGESSQSKVMMQLVPSSPSVVNNSSTVCRQVHPSTSNRDVDVISSPPEWFGNFVNNYKKHEMWKMSQLVKMQQELMDMENKKLAVLEKILGTLKKGD